MIKCSILTYKGTLTFEFVAEKPDVKKIKYLKHIVVYWVKNYIQRFQVFK